MGAQVVRLRPVAPFLVTLMEPTGTTLPRRSLELALVVLECKAQRFGLIIMSGTTFRKLYLRVAACLSRPLVATFVATLVGLLELFRAAT